MKRNKDICFICGGAVNKISRNHYFKCRNCGHEKIDNDHEQKCIINDVLDIDDVRNINFLDKFKNRILQMFKQSNGENILLDIGSASGVFLFQNNHHFIECYGLEVTPEAVEFSSSKLGLNIVEDISKIDEKISIATAWHSFEHIPESELIVIVKKLSKMMKNDGRLIISAPNASSIQYKLFNKSYAFYDYPNHLHQFTPKSLDLLLHSFGFEKFKQVVSWPYNVFGYAQGLLNIFNSKHNYLYYRFKRRSIKGHYILDAYNLLLLIPLIPIVLMLPLVDSFFSNYESVVTICYKKK